MSNFALLSEKLELVAAEGSAPKVNILAYNGGIMTVPGFGPVVVDLAGLELSASVTLLKDHKNTLEDVLGQGVPEVRDGQLHVDGNLVASSDWTPKLVDMSKAGVSLQASIGLSNMTKRHVKAGETVFVNGRRITATGPGFTLVSKSRLREVTVCALGCDAGTSVSIAAKENLQMTAFEQWLQAKGWDGAALSDAQKSTLNAAYDAELKASEQPIVAEVVTPDVTAELRASAAAESKRIAAVHKLCGTEHVELAAKAIEEGWDENKTKLEVLLASRHAPTGHVMNNEVTGDVLEAAACLVGGIESPEKHFKEQTLEAAHKRFRRGIGLQELFLEAAWASGYHGRQFRGNERDVLHAAFSTTSLSGILANTANKFLLQGFMGVEDTWKPIAARRNVSDFKQVTSYRMSGAFQFDKVGPSGELTHGSVSEDSYTNQAETYGKMFAITRTMLINDDMGALSDIPRRIGRGAALKLNDVFWTEFMADADTFFTTARANYFEGAATTLQVSSLTTAEQKFLDQTDPDSKPLGVMPKFLVVPNALNVTASQLMRDLEVRDTTASTKFTTGNPHAGKWQVIRSSYLGNSAYTGYSSTAWYLLADPMDLAMIEVAFLNGQETPVVESADADFNTLGVQMRGYFDFGVNKQEYRAAVKSKGAA